MMTRRCAHASCGKPFDAGDASRAAWRGVHADRFCSPTCYAAYVGGSVERAGAVVGRPCSPQGFAGGDDCEREHAAGDRAKSAAAASGSEGRAPPTAAAAAATASPSGDRGDDDHALDVAAGTDDLGLLAAAAGGTPASDEDAALARVAPKQQARPHRRFIEALQSLVSGQPVVVRAAAAQWRHPAGDDVTHGRARATTTPCWSHPSSSPAASSV